MKITRLLCIFSFFCFIWAETETKSETKSETEVKTKHTFSDLWGRKYYAGIGYKYLAFGEMGGLQNLQVTYGVWDKNKMGIYAEVLFPFTQVDSPEKGSRITAVNLFWLYNISVTNIFSISPKIGYGLSVVNYGSKNHIAWKPSFGVDLSIFVIDNLALYLDYDYSFYHLSNFSHLHYFGAGLRYVY
ncbi:MULTISPECIES: hypothetical protein [unclassified Helicobacter]|uniref:hypothetical protein n=1 Tax=unclassified Helicobacter TaxID=2593540 RepID=UPI000CF17417|nr:MULTISPECIES: hypothetical protein [unclassified Helicobacter]